MPPRNVPIHFALRRILNQKSCSNQLINQLTDVRITEGITGKNLHPKSLYRSRVNPPIVAEVPESDEQ